MHVRRKGTRTRGCGENTIYREKISKSFGEWKKAGNTESGLNAGTLHAGKLCKDNTWKRIKHCVAKVFCNRRKAEKHVPYASLTRLDRLSFSEDELKRAQKKLRFCLKRTQQHEYCTENELSDESDDELDCFYDSILRERVERSTRFSERRPGICKEIERRTEGDKNTSLLELRKTLIINNRFKEMGL